MGIIGFLKNKGSKGSKVKEIMADVSAKQLPRHVAIIMDGNGRWAQKRRLPRIAGHRQGVEALREIIKITSELDIRYLTLYAFSTENWRRPRDEVNALMSLLVEYLQKEVDELDRNGVRINMLGDIEGLPDEVSAEILSAVNKTKHNDKLQVNIALNYGSRAEILNAVKSIVRDAVEGTIDINNMDDTLFARYLYTREIPDPDLLIRTSGEFRLSNFLLYQMAYTELIFTDKDIYWPDFDRYTYLKTIQEYQNRRRRYGGIDAGEGET
jgi:undecaprenyl diphosphate synthase